MIEILYLLLPLAFYSGWKAAKKNNIKQCIKSNKLADDYVKGVNYLLSEKPDKALEVFINHPDVDEYTAETYLLLGNMFRNRGELDRALCLHQNLMARSSLSKDQKESVMFSLGEDYLAAGMLDRAESVF
jgi:lipopolysaccharide biosynthesis regulator YciM